MQVRNSILILILIVVCIGSYFNSLSGDFVWDDGLFIVENPYVKSFRYLPQFFIKDFWSIYIKSMPSHYYRPVLALSFMVDFFFWKENPLGFHVSNLIFHILTCVLVFVFVGLLIKDRFIAFAASLLFAVHPLNVEAVSFISGRVDSIPCVFFLLSLILFLKYNSLKKRSIYLLSLICFFVSLLAKEMAITLPLVAICIDYLFFSQQDIKKVIKNFGRLHLGFFVVAAAYLTIRSYVVGWSFIKETSDLGINFYSGTAPLWRLFTVMKILALYLGLFFFPYKLNVNHAFIPANSLFEPLVIIGILLLFLSVYIYLKNKRFYPILSFSIAWFFITIMPVSNVIPQLNIFAERYMYIPSIGLCLGMGFFFSWLLHKEVKTSIFNWRKSVIFIFILLILALGRVTFERNKVWQDDFTLWLDAVKSETNSTRSHHNLGLVYFKLKLWDKALREYNLALQSKVGISVNSQSRILYNSGQVYIKKGMIDEAIKAFGFAIELDPRQAEYYSDLSIAYGLKGQYAKAIEACLKALEIDNHLYETYYNLALNYIQIGDKDKAIGAYENYLKIEPNYANVHLDLGYLYYSKNNIPKAREHWLKALELSGGYPPAREALKLLKDQHAY